jgi:hypothetical protein
MMLLLMLMAPVSITGHDIHLLLLLGVKILLQLLWIPLRRLLMLLMLVKLLELLIIQTISITAILIASTAMLLLQSLLQLHHL